MDVFFDLWVELYVEYIDSDFDVICFNCLLNGCIGWFKIYNSIL